MPQLLVHRGTSFCQEYVFSNVDCLLIGRARTNDIHLPDSSRRVSRCHAALIRLAPRSERYFLRDLGSLRGTSVVGQSIFQHTLREGDVIEIADYELLYSDQEPSVEDFNPLRVVFRSKAGQAMEGSTALLTHRELQREMNLTPAQNELMESLLQAANRRTPGRDLLAQMLPAILQINGAARGFVAAFRSGSERVFDVLARIGMSPRDQIEITNAEFLNILQRGQPLLESRVILSPIFVHETVMGFFALEKAEGGISFGEPEAEFLALLGRIAGSRHRGATSRARTASHAVIEWPAALIGRSAPMQELRQQILHAARAETNILLQGESGVGKELVALAIHEASKHAAGPFLAKNCAAITETLAEAEIFGHAPRSGIAGADAEGAPGWFEQAMNGTLFLDEIHGLTLGLQDKFLRVLQEKQVCRVRGRKTVAVNAQIIAASDHDLEQATEEGTVRAPLFFRFGKRIQVPPLRDRVEDIPLLAFCFLDRYAHKLDSPVRTFSHKALRLLERYPWPGNVRELENHIKTAVSRVRDREILFSWDLQELASKMQSTPVDRGNAEKIEGSLQRNSPTQRAEMPQAMSTIEKEKILETLEATRGNISRAAKLLGYRSRQTILNKMDRFEIPRSYGDPEIV